MQQFTIKDVENLLGIKAHTLRIWEQRYNFFAPKRKESTHRLYDNDDLKFLLQVAFLYHQCWKISKIAALSPEEVSEAVAQVPLNGDTYPHFVVELIRHAIGFDEISFSDQLNEIILQIGFERTVEEICFPFLRRVGLLWMTNHIVPAQEHFSSYIIQNRIIAATENLALPQKPAEMILFAPKGEFHELPLLYLNYLLRKNGWAVLFLGKNISLDVLRQCAEQPGVKYLFLHLLTNLTQIDPDLYLEELIRMFPDKKIVVSGTIVHQIQRSFLGVKLLLSDKEIHEFIAQK